MGKSSRVKTSPGRGKHLRFRFGLLPLFLKAGVTFCIYLKQAHNLNILQKRYIVSEEKEIMNFSDYSDDYHHYNDPLFPPAIFTPEQQVLLNSSILIFSLLDFNHFQKRYGAWVLYAIGSLVTAVAAVIINKRY